MNIKQIKEKVKARVIQEKVIKSKYTSGFLDNIIMTTMQYYDEEISKQVNKQNTLKETKEVKVTTTIQATKEAKQEEIQETFLDKMLNKIHIFKGISLNTKIR